LSLSSVIESNTEDGVRETRKRASGRNFKKVSLTLQRPGVLTSASIYGECFSQTNRQSSTISNIHISLLTLSALTASQNEAAIKNMLYGQVLSNLFPLLIRILLRWQAFRQSKKAIAFYCLSLALSQFLYQYLRKSGTPRRDETGNLVFSGDDLNHPGMTEWIFDILYISCESENKHYLGIHPFVIRRVCSSGFCHSWGVVLVDIRCGTFLIYLFRRLPHDVPLLRFLYS
jgi:SRP-independent targeting protein 2/TMEM208